MTVASGAPTGARLSGRWPPLSLSPAPLRGLPLQARHRAVCPTRGSISTWSGSSTRTRPGTHCFLTSRKSRGSSASRCRRFASVRLHGMCAVPHWRCDDQAAPAAGDVGPVHEVAIAGVEVDRRRAGTLEARARCVSSLAADVNRFAGGGEYTLQTEQGQTTSLQPPFCRRSPDVKSSEPGRARSGRRDSRSR